MLAFYVRDSTKHKETTRRPRSWWVDNIKMNLERQDGVVWPGLVWLRIETSGRLL
jgi:hypothetical protein